MKKLITSLFLFLLPVFLHSQTITDSYIAESKFDYAKSLEIMESLSKAEPNDYFIQLRAGWAALLKGDFAKSNSYYQKATLLAPNAIEPRIGQMKALSALGQNKQMEVVCQTILKMDPKNYLVKSKLAYSNFLTGNYKESEKYYESILVDYPADTEMMIGLGWVYIKQNKKQKANDIFSKLSKYIPEEPRVKDGLYYSK